MSKSSDPVVRFRNDGFEAAAPELAEHAEAIRRLGKRILSDVLEIGERLTKARALIAHGHWLRWLETEFRWSDETARRFMGVFEMSKFHNLRDLGQQIPMSALYTLARPSTSEETRDEVFARCEAGETVSVADVQATIAESKVAARAVNVQVVSGVVTLMAPVYVAREPAITVVRPVYTTPEDIAARRLVDTIEAYGAALTDAKKSALLRAAAGRDRAAIRRCLDIIMAEI